MKINNRILRGAVPLLLSAACAPEPGWSEAPACGQLRCADAGQTCWASSPALELSFDKAVLDAGEALASVAVVPWVPGRDQAQCVEDRGCADQERCVQGSCWKAPVSSAALRSWLSGEGPLAKSLPSWWATRRGERGLLLQSTLGSEQGGVWAVYLGPRWVDAQGIALGGGDDPVAMLSVQGHGAGRWSQQTPKLSQDGLGLVVPVPEGWVPQASYLWSLSCDANLGVEIFAERSCPGPQPCVAFALDQALSLEQRSCRVLVKIPGHAALPTGWIRAHHDRVLPKGRF